MSQGQGSWGLALAISALAELSLGGPFLPVWQTCSQQGLGLPGCGSWGHSPHLGPHYKSWSLFQQWVVWGQVWRGPSQSPQEGDVIWPTVWARQSAQGRNPPPQVTGSGRWLGTSAGTGVAPSPHPQGEACRRLGGEDPPRAWSMRRGKVLDSRSAQRSGVEKAVLVLPLWLSQSCCPRPQPSQD